MLIFDPSVNGPGAAPSIIDVAAVADSVADWTTYDIVNTWKPPIYANGLLRVPGQYSANLSPVSVVQIAEDPANDPRTPPTAYLSYASYAGTAAAIAIGETAQVMNSSGPPASGGAYGFWGMPGVWVATYYTVNAVALSTTTNYGNNWQIKAVLPIYPNTQTVVGIGSSGDIYIAFLTKTDLVVMVGNASTVGWAQVDNIPLSSLSPLCTFFFANVVGGGVVLFISGYTTSWQIVPNNVITYYYKGTASRASYNSAIFASYNYPDWRVYTNQNTLYGAAIVSLSSSGGQSAQFILYPDGPQDVTQLLYGGAPAVLPLNTNFGVCQLLQTAAQIYPGASLSDSYTVSPI